MRKYLNKVLKHFSYRLEKMRKPDPFAEMPATREPHEIMFKGVRVLTTDEVMPFPGAPEPRPAPNIIPDNLREEFTQRESIPVHYRFRYYPKGFSTHNTAQRYQEVFAMLAARTFRYYTNEVNAFYDALDKYSVKDKSVSVWGLTGCNCDAMAIWKGAAEVVVIDYNKPVCDHDKIRVFNLEEFEKSGIKTDFAISFSSFEHDGLGRYGDPISPNGDLRAMRETHGTLTKGGILLLGVPLGRDCLVWNDVRIYGPLRLPLLLRGWECLDVFNSYGEVTPDFPFDLPFCADPQPLLVLRKIDTDYPDDAWFAHNIEAMREEISAANEQQGTRDPKLRLRILEMLRKHAKDQGDRNAV